jgi:hypothetical protein
VRAAVVVVTVTVFGSMSEAEGETNDVNMGDAAATPAAAVAVDEVCTQV